MWFQDQVFKSELQLPNKPLPRQKPTAETFSDTPLPGWDRLTIFPLYTAELGCIHIWMTVPKNNLTVF